ncbi:MAG TPA: hypothetical protein VK700_21845 [Steroidobacteraceae bacterium]|jgi:hypothetical protein|nr:hypothetical protein [Steroidobacteraceae bacterium]
MPQILYPPARAQSVREVLNTGGQIFRLSLNATLPYGILIALCGELPNLRNLSLDLPVQTLVSTDPGWWAWFVAGTMLALLFGGAMILRQKALAAGERTSVAAEMRQAFGLLSRLIVCVALSTAAVMLALLPVGAVLPLTGLNPTLTNLASVKVGMLLLLIPASLPGAWLSLGLLFAPALLVLRKLGPIAAMGGSFGLLRGNWWRASLLTGALAGILVLVLVLMATVAGAAVVVSGVTDVKSVATMALPLGIVCRAIITPWCGAQLLAMMGDLMVRQDEARRAGTGDSNGTSTGPTA